MFHRVSLLLLLLCAVSQVQALTSDRDQPIHIEADYVHIDKKAGISEYRGNVHLTQGSMEITGDEVTVHQPKGQLSTIVVKGKPATFRQQPDGQEDVVHSQALKMEYQAQQERILLFQDAKVQQGGQQFAGNRIVFNTRSSTVIAQGDEQQHQRVRAVIVPRQNETAK